MGVKKSWKASAAVLLALIALLTGTITCFASWSDSKPVRVGIFPLGNFQNIDADGNVYGYNIDYLNKIGEFKHWQYEYVQVSNWVEATEYLEEGRIDLLAPAQNIPELAARFAYAAFPLGTEAAAVYVPEGRTDLVYQDFERMETLRYGGAEGSSFTKNFLLRAAERGFEPNLTYYSNTTELFSALENGEVDAIVTNIMFNNPDIKIIDRFSPLPVYYISTKDNTYLLDELHEAMCSVELSEPSFETQLMAKHFPFYSNVDFTYDELQYIKHSPEIKIGYWPAGRPLSYQNEETGEFDGITRDILDRISEISGLHFTYVALPNTPIDLSYFKENDIYVLSGVSYNDENLAVPELWMSAPYLNTENFLIGREDLQFDPNLPLKLITASGSATFPSHLHKMYPNFQVEVAADIGTCFKKVAGGEADILIQNRYIVEPYLVKPIYQSLQTLPVQSLEDRLCLATLHHAGDISTAQGFLDDGRFISIINKSIEKLTSDEVNAILIHRTFGNQYHYKLSDFIYQYRYLLMVLSILLVVLIAGAIKIERMKEHENRILSHAIEQANRANVAKSQFLSNMSHEIRTPLNAIVGMTALADRVDGNPQKTKQYLSKITESSRLLMSIINDVLDMSAIESQKLRISEQSFDFKALLTSLSELYYAQCKQKGIRFEMHLEEVKHEILVGDSLRVNQILMNLLSNAYKFTESGGTVIVTVSETLFSEEKQKVFMRFVVSDTGCGMSDEMMGRLFQAFEQESSDTALRHGGSGLGLAITKNLVNLMHGEIKAASTKNVGTTFTVDLPFTSTDEVLPSDTTKLKDIRVLVVDDDSYMCEYLASILSGMGVRFDVVNTGEAALSLLEQGMSAKDPYNVCFIDWRMPEMDGIEVTKQIREKISDKVLAIIVSAYDLSEVTDEAKAAGIDQVISKPLFQSSIYNILISLQQKYPAAVALREDLYDFTGKRALLAEDFELNREMAVDLLNLVNLEVDCAVDGRQAVDMFTQSEPGTYSVVLMDIQMPIMDGYEAIKLIRRSNHSQASNIPIYAMTANAFSEDVAKALSAGANGHIAKPIDTKALYQLLYKCMMEENVR